MISINELIIHDIEIYPNCFLDTFKFPNKKELYIVLLYPDESLDRQDILNMYINKGYIPKFVTIKYILLEIIPKYYLFGYNSFRFDDPLWNLISKKYNKYVKTNDISGLIKEIYNEAEYIIKSNKKSRYSHGVVKTIDGMRVTGLDRLMKPLKQVAANLRHELILDLPIEPGTIISKDQVKEICYYNFFGDILATEKLLCGISDPSPIVPKTARNGCFPDIEFRSAISELFKLDLLNYNKSMIGAKLALELYARESGLDTEYLSQLTTNREEIKYSDIILDFITFKSKPLQKLLIDINKFVYEPAKKSKEYGKKFIKKINFANCDIVFAQGGLHGVPDKGSVIVDAEIIDLDGDSFYPYIYWKHEAYPEHLPMFPKFVESLIVNRIKYKKAGNKIYANGLKTPINRIYGGFGDDHGFLKDYKALLKTTINGQLMLLMLVEEFHLNGFKVIYQNTDGISILYDESKKDKYNEICAWWSKITQINLSIEEYSKFIIMNVNNYLVVKKNGKYKMKGCYEYSSFIEKYDEFDVSGSYNMPIIPYAVFKYYTENIPIHKTIINHKYILDFCSCQKVGKQFENELLTLDGVNVCSESIQRSIRFYASNKGKFKIRKVKDLTDKELLSLLKKKKAINCYFHTNTIIPNAKTIRIIDGKEFKVLEYHGFTRDDRCEWLSYTEAISGKTVELLNEYDCTLDISTYNIDYSYYIEEANKLLITANYTDLIKEKEITNQLKLF